MLMELNVWNKEIEVEIYVVDAHAKRHVPLKKRAKRHMWIYMK